MEKKPSCCQARDCERVTTFLMVRIDAWKTHLALLNEPVGGFDRFAGRLVQDVGHYAHGHDSDVAIEELGIGSKGCEERDCGGLLREILGHGGLSRRREILL